MVNSYPLIYKNLVVDHYLNDNDTIKNTIKIYKISKSSLFNWIKLYKNNELAEKKKYKKMPYYSNEIKQYIVSYVTKRINFRWKLLKRIIKSKFNKKISRSMIYKILQTNKVTYRSIQHRNIHKNKKKYNKQVKDHKLRMNKLNMDDIISIDETHFDSYINIGYGWGTKGKRIIKRKYLKYNKRYTLICAISNSQIVHYDIIKGSANGDIFYKFMNKLIGKYVPNNKYFLLDNARIHHTQKLKAKINGTSNELLYNVPYTPELNPIELMFSKIKQEVKIKDNNENTINLIKNIHTSLKKINGTYLSSIYEHVQKLL